MESLTPNLFVTDINQTIAFYQTLGFQLVMKVPEEGDLVWAMMSCGQVSFMFQTFSSMGDELPEIKRERGSGPLLLYIKIHGIRDFFNKICDTVHVIKGLETTFYGSTEFSIFDCNGMILTFAEDEVTGEG